VPIAAWTAPPRSPSHDATQIAEPPSATAATLDTSTNILAIGRIVGTHGIRGDLKLLTFNPDSEAITPGIRVTLRSAELMSEKTIDSVRSHKRLLLIRLEGCNSMTEAEALVGAEVCLSADDLPEIGPDELYHYELMGMDVVTAEGTHLGRIVEILTTGAHDVCTIRGGGHEYMVPLIASVVKEVDKSARRLIIDPLPGLLDL